MKKLLCLLTLLAAVLVTRAEDPALYEAFSGGGDTYSPSTSQSYVNAWLLNTNQTPFANVGLGVGSPIAVGTMTRVIPVPYPYTTNAGWVIAPPQEAGADYIDIFYGKHLTTAKRQLANGTIDTNTKGQREFDKSRSFNQYRVQGWDLIAGTHYDTGWTNDTGYSKSYFDYKGIMFSSYTLPIGDGSGNWSYTDYRTTQYHVYSTSPAWHGVRCHFSGRRFAPYTRQNVSYDTDPVEFELKWLAIRATVDGFDCTPRWNACWDLIQYYADTSISQASFF